MSWITDVQTVTSNAKSTISAVSNNITNTFSIGTNKTIDMIDSFFANGYSIVGINANQIPAMKVAVESYVNSINTELAKLENYNPYDAIKAEVSI